MYAEIEMEHAQVLEQIKKSLADSEEGRKIQRMEFSLKEFAKGNIRVLQSAEFVNELLRRLTEDLEQDLDERKSLLMQLGAAVNTDEVELRNRSLMVFSLAVERALAKKDKDVAIILGWVFCRWLDKEKDVLPGFEVVMRRGEDLAAWFLAREAWEEGLVIVEIFSRTHRQDKTKNNAMRSAAGKALHNLGSSETLERLTNYYLRGEEQAQNAFLLLQLFRSDSVRYLFRRVTDSPNRQERLELIALIAGFGKAALTALSEFLQERPSWADLRNIVWIIAEIGDESAYEMVAEYFAHKDVRVQYEMVRCVVKLGGEQMRHRLLYGLEKVHDKLKVHIVMLLTEQGHVDESIMTTVCRLAEKRSSLGEELRGELIHAVIGMLKKYPSGKGLLFLEKISNTLGKDDGNELLRQQIEDGLKFIKPKLRHSNQSGEGNGEGVSFAHDPGELQGAHNRIRDIENKVRRLLAKGDARGAGKLLHEHAERSVEVGDYQMAELLRDRMLEVDPMALAEVIALGEMIEERKTNSISNHHMAIWRDLCDDLSTDRYNTLYQHLRNESYSRGDRLVTAGETDSTLYFLNSGYISLTCSAGGKDVFLKRIQPGEILGSEHFFSPSVWTVNLEAISQVQVQVLDHNDLKLLELQSPGITRILQDHCRKYMRVPELLKMSGEDRRQYPRHQIACLTHNILVDHYGNKGKRIFKGELIDISRGGMAFTVRIASSENARALLGRQIITAVELGDKSTLPQTTGVIVGVRYREKDHQGYSIHVRLTKAMASGDINRLLETSED